MNIIVLLVLASIGVIAAKESYFGVMAAMIGAAAGWIGSALDTLMWKRKED